MPLSLSPTSTHGGHRAFVPIPGSYYYLVPTHIPSDSAIGKVLDVAGASMAEAR